MSSGRVVSTLLALAGLSFGPGIALSGLPTVEDANPIVTTANGQLQGVATGAGRYFRGIPYAAAPVGDLTLREPHPPLNWTGVRDASQYGADCIQLTEVVHNQTICPAWNTISGCNNISADCLFLNIVTPNVTAATPEAQKWPVLVYVHAGEFYVGSGNDLENNWPYALHDVVLVTFNYRLGNSGFLATEELRSRNSDNSTGNYGFQDQRAVLQWVKINIAAFGGDPENVVLMGESSGGTSVAAHLVAKKSWGLFHKVIMESPGVTQYKMFEDNQADTYYRLATLALANVSGCEMLPFGGDYDAPGAWLAMPNIQIAGKPMAQGSYASERDAVNACNAMPACMGLTCSNYTNTTTNATMVAASFSPTYTAVLGKNGIRTTTYLRAPNRSTTASCFLGLDPHALYKVYQAPHEDTAFKDLYGLTLDGVEFSQPVSTTLLTGDIAPGVDVLMGSNLDEGTEFIFLTSPVTCNMTEHDLTAWAEATFTSDWRDWSPQTAAQIAAGIVETYLSSDVSNASTFQLEMPVPACSGFDYPSTAAYVAATRATGDSCFYCWVRKFAERLTNASPLQANGSSLYHYYFTHTPTVSANMNALPEYGAFHGSEVPFVFGYPPELGTDAERALSTAMGCYWSNFAHTGNPNSGPCNTTLFAPVAWPQYKPVGSASTVAGNTLIIDAGNASGLPPSQPIHVVQNHRADKCALFEPLLPPASAHKRQQRN